MAVLEKPLALVRSLSTSLKEWGGRHAQASSPCRVTIGTVTHYKLATSIRAEVKRPRQRWHRPVGERPGGHFELTG